MLNIKTKKTMVNQKLTFEQSELLISKLQEKLESFSDEDDMGLYQRGMYDAYLNALTLVKEESENYFNDWIDENSESPKESGQYLCLVKWYDSDDYHYTILEYEKKTGWQVTDSCEHILWRNLPPKTIILNSK